MNHNMYCIPFVATGPSGKESFVRQTLRRSTCFFGRCGILPKQYIQLLRGDMLDLWAFRTWREKWVFAALYQANWKSESGFHSIRLFFLRLWESWDVFHFVFIPIVNAGNVQCWVIYQLCFFWWSPCSSRKGSAKCTLNWGLLCVAWISWIKRTVGLDDSLTWLLDWLICFDLFWFMPLTNE